jgi:hypothetical protein
MPKIPSKAVLINRELPKEIAGAESIECGTKKLPTNPQA